MGIRLLRLSKKHAGGRGSVRGNRQGSHLAQQSPARRRQKELLQNVKFCNSSLKNRLRAMKCGPHFAFYKRENRAFSSPFVYSCIVQQPLLLSLTQMAGGSRTFPTS